MAISGAAAIRAEFPKRDVDYLLGGEDVREAALEQSAAARLQGANRLERGQIYFHYLRNYFGEQIEAHQRIRIVPCVGHEHSKMWRSSDGQRALFQA